MSGWLPPRDRDLAGRIGNQRRAVAGSVVDCRAEVAA
jgi:hypothetical protein